eukprot:350789-Chlamydomonas_euryale.AAC.5
MSDTGRALSRRVAASALSRRAAKACWACAGAWTGPVSVCPGSVWDARVSWAGGNGAGNCGAAAAGAPRTSTCCTTEMSPASAAGQGAAGPEPANNTRDLCVVAHQTGH